MHTEYQTLWNRCLAVIKDIVPEAAFNTWFVPIVPLSYEDNKFTIQVPSQFFYEYLEVPMNCAIACATACERHAPAVFSAADLYGFIGKPLKHFHKRLGGEDGSAALLNGAGHLFYQRNFEIGRGNSQFSFRTIRFQ